MYSTFHGEVCRTVEYCIAQSVFVPELSRTMHFVEAGVAPFHIYIVGDRSKALKFLDALPN
jgi:hypothetical protein